LTVEDPEVEVPGVGGVAPSFGEGTPSGEGGCCPPAGRGTPTAAPQWGQKTPSPHISLPQRKQIIATSFLVGRPGFAQLSSSGMANTRMWNNHPGNLAPSLPGRSRFVNGCVLPPWREAG